MLLYYKKVPVGALFRLLKKHLDYTFINGGTKKCPIE